MAFEPVLKIREAEAQAQQIRQDAAERVKTIMNDAQAQVCREVDKMEADASARVAESKAAGEAENKEIINKGSESARQTAEQLKQNTQKNVDRAVEACMERIKNKWLS